MFFDFILILNYEDHNPPHVEELASKTLAVLVQDNSITTELVAAKLSRTKT